MRLPLLHSARLWPGSATTYSAKSSVCKLDTSMLA